MAQSSPEISIIQKIYSAINGGDTEAALAYLDVHVHVRLKDATDWVDAKIVDGFRFQNGKVVEFHTFLNRQQAIEWASSPN